MPPLPAPPPPVPATTGVAESAQRPDVQASPALQALSVRQEQPLSPLAQVSSIRSVPLHPNASTAVDAINSPNSPGTLSTNTSDWSSELNTTSAPTAAQRPGGSTVVNRCPRPGTKRAPHQGHGRRCRLPSGCTSGRASGDHHSAISSAQAPRFVWTRSRWCGCGLATSPGEP